MTRIILLLMLLIPTFTFSQSQEVLAHLHDGAYKVDSNKVVVTKLFESVNGSKKDLYKTVKGYLIDTYSDHNSELTEDDETIGVLEIKSVAFSFFLYTAESTIPVNYHVFFTLRVDVYDNQYLATCSAADWIAEWSTIGYGYKVERHFVTDCVPLGEQKVFDDGDKTVDAFRTLVNKMHDIASAVDNYMIESK